MRDCFLTSWNLDFMKLQLTFNVYFKFTAGFLSSMVRWRFPWLVASLLHHGVHEHQQLMAKTDQRWWLSSSLSLEESWACRAMSSDFWLSC